MRYSAKFILFLVQSLLVQSDDPDSNYFYHELLKKTHRSNAVPISFVSGKDRPPVLYPNVFHERSYFKTQATTPSTVLYNIRSSWSNMSEKIEANRIARAYCQYAADECSYGGVEKCDRRWCCPYGENCGRTHGACDTLRSSVAQQTVDILTVVVVLFIWCFGLVRCCIHVVRKYCVQSNNFVQSYNPAIYRSTAVQLLQTSTRPGELPRYLEGTRQYIEQCNLRQLGTQNLLSDTSSRNLTSSIEQQLPENNSYNIEIVTTSSSSPPSYNDVVGQSSITITMEQQSLLPPSYDDFIRANYEREEADL